MKNKLYLLLISCLLFISSSYSQSANDSIVKTDSIKPVFKSLNYYSLEYPKCKYNCEYITIPIQNYTFSDKYMPRYSLYYTSYNKQIFTWDNCRYKYIENSMNNRDNYSTDDIFIAAINGLIALIEYSCY